MQNYNDEFRDDSKLADIQLQLSTNISDEYETENQIDELYEILINLSKESKFNTLYKKYEKGDNIMKLLKDEASLNTMFFMFIQALPKKKYKIYLAFVVFCDFFELPYDRTFTKLSNKVKRFLENSLKNIIGNKIYRKFEKKYKFNGENIKLNTIHDLL